MCGILGYVGEREDAVQLLVEGLKRLEYRGYDSAGVAVAGEGGIERRRAAGKLRNLEEVLRNDPLAGRVGIAHTRWATHGRPSEENAHPHTDCSGDLVLVHNGIIEAHLDLKTELTEGGHRFETETDTEVIAHLVEDQEAGDLAAAVRAAVARLEGAYALAVLSARQPDRIVAAKHGPPLVVGVGDGEHFVSSDVSALLPLTRRMIHLEDGEVAVVTAGGVSITDASGRPVEREPETIRWDPVQAEKGPYRHFMLKEIHEQPLAIRDTFMGKFSHEEGKILLPELGMDEGDANEIERVTLIACGTSWHAAVLGQIYMERLAGLPAVTDVASEHRYRQAPHERGELVVALSQSGETADTLAALGPLRAAGSRTIAITNVPGSRITRDTDAHILTHAGPEIGVAATKTFTTQLVALYLLSLWIGQARGRQAEDRIREHARNLAALPYLAEQALRTDALCNQVARRFHHCTGFLFLGRGPSYPVVMEGALKLKEISYIHAEAYPAGEMKHGPIALIDENMPVVALCPHDDLYGKMTANLQEARARDGRLIVITDGEDPHLTALAEEVLVVPRTGACLQPLLFTIPLQLLAYHIGLRRGCDVDQPRNLAKSVTVE